MITPTTPLRELADALADTQISPAISLSDGIWTVRVGSETYSRLDLAAALDAAIESARFQRRLSLKGTQP